MWGGRYLSCINPDGSLKWAFEVGRSASAPVIDREGTLYFDVDESSNHYIYALSRDGTLKWRYKGNLGFGGSPVIGADGTIYIGSDDGRLYAVGGTEMATTYYVNATTGNDLWDGTSPDYEGDNVGPKATIQAGINAAEDEDTVIVAQGRYFENIDFRRKSITVTSTNPDNPDVVAATVIDGAQKGSVVTFNSGEDANSVLKGFTITNGHAVNGGGIFCTDCGTKGSRPTIINCRIIGNSASGDGGGMFNHYSYPKLTNCTFSGNSAGGNGGGVYNYYGGNVTLTNCAFSGNSTGQHGGGMYIYYASSTLTNCTFTENSADLAGGGLYIRGLHGGSPALTNCILWNNSDSGGVDESAQIEGAMPINYSCIQGWTGDLGGTGNIDADPLFVDAYNGNHHLLEDSPCIDAGDPNYIAEPNETDLDGRPRVIGGRIDMGAYEYIPPIPAEVRIVPRTLNLSSEGNWITCYIWLGEDYNVADIDPNSVLLEDEIQAESLSVDEQEQVAIARFSRSAVQAILNVGRVELTITGQLTNGTIFEGTDTIRVIDKAGKK